MGGGEERQVAWKDVADVVWTTEVKISHKWLSPVCRVMSSTQNILISFVCST